MLSSRVSLNAVPFAQGLPRMTRPAFKGRPKATPEDKTPKAPQKGMFSRLARLAMMLAVMIPGLGGSSATVMAGEAKKPQQKYVAKIADTLEEHFSPKGDPGPYNLNVPGGYGRNAAYNYNRVEQISGRDYAARAATVRYNPEDASEADRSTNAFGYVQEMNRKFTVDTNRDGKLSQRELLATFDGNVNATRAYIQGMDRADATGQKDGKISPAEQAAYVLLQDDATRLLLNKSQEIVQKVLTHESKVPGKAFQEAKAFLSQAPRWVQKYNSRPDGEIDGGERFVAMHCAVHMPTLTGMVLDDLMKTNQLEVKSQAFEKEFLKAIATEDLFNR